MDPYLSRNFVNIQANYKIYGKLVFNTTAINKFIMI